MSDSNEKVLDPETGLYVSESVVREMVPEVVREMVPEVVSENVFQSVLIDEVRRGSLPNERLISSFQVDDESVSLNDLLSPEYASQGVNLAVLFNYSDDKDDKDFAEIFLPEIKSDYNSFTKIFFNDFGKGFSSAILDKIWNSFKNFSLANSVLEKYEELNHINRDKISPVKMIQLHKECAIKKITSVSKRVFALKLSEFLNALSSVDVRGDGHICANITFNLFFKSLCVGVKIVLRFAIYQFPSELIGKMSADDKVGFNLRAVPSPPIAGSVFKGVALGRGSVPAPVPVPVPELDIA